MKGTPAQAIVAREENNGGEEGGIRADGSARTGPRNGADAEAAVVGKFLLGMVSGGLLVSGGLVVSAMLFPASPANDNQPAAPVEEPIAAPAATEPEASVPDATATAPAETVTPAEDQAEDKADAAKIAEPVKLAEADPSPAPAPEVTEAAPAAPEGDTAAAGPAPSAPAAEVAKPETGAEPSKPATAEADSPASPEVAPPKVAAAETPVTPVAEPESAATPDSPDATQLADAGTAASTEPAAAPEAAPEPAPEPEPVAPATTEPATAEAPATEPTESAEATEAPASEAAPSVTEPVSEAAAEQAPAAEAAPTPAVEPDPVAPAAPEAPAPEPVAEAPPTEPPAPDLPTGEAAPAAPMVEPAPESPTAEAPTPETPAPETPAPEAPAPEEPAPEEPAAEAPADAMPAPTEVVPGTPVPDMPGQKPEALPGTAEAPATALAEAEGGSTFKPAPGLVRAGEGVIIGRDAPAEAAPADPAAGTADPRPLAQFAAPFENPEARPPLAIVLVDPGTAELDRASLAALPFPVTFALDPLDPASAGRAEIYRAGGKEVVMLVTGIAQGAQASDVEVAFQSMEQGLPQAIAAMDLADPTFQNNRLLASTVVPILKAQGRGLLTWDEGLNAADQVARRDDLEAAVVFRNLDQAGGDGVALRRLLDRAVFKADQDGRVSVVGTADPATVAALLEWTVEGKAATVALAPLSAVLRVD